MKLRVYRTLWGVLHETDGASAESPFLDTDEGSMLLKGLGAGLITNAKMTMNDWFP